MTRSKQSPTKLTGEQLTRALRARLAGGDPVALWEERGDRVLVHAAAATAEVHAQGIIVTVPLETAETGRATVTVALALASGDESPDCVMATDEDAEGHPILAGRWGAALQDAIHDALLGLLEDEAKAGGGEPLGFHVHGGAVTLVSRVLRGEP
jgi:hypothetical protein